MEATIWHNPRCRKSREGFKFLEENGVQLNVYHYLENSPTENEIKDLLEQMGAVPRDILRKGEKEFKELGLKDQNLTDDILIEAMSSHPKLIERPIVIAGNKAALGRPLENLVAFFEQNIKK